VIGDNQEFWVFGYGSLMWRPGFAYDDVKRAQAIGYARSFCIYSTHHRGSHERPGLVLGLDRGGMCAGRAYRVPQSERARVVAYLRAREQVNGVYRECWVPIWLDDLHRQVLALTYIAERAHPSYAGRLPFQHQVRLIRAAQGKSGANVDYLVSTARHLIELGVRDRHLERLVNAIGGLFARRAGGPEVSACSKALVAACRLDPPSAPRMPSYARTRFIHRMHLQDRWNGRSQAKPNGD
jgi:glutathione-specific gamma-glutamylcyclotransferase